MRAVTSKHYQVMFKLHLVLTQASAEASEGKKLVAHEVMYLSN